VNYNEALAWLYGLQQFGIKLGLENIERLIESLGLSTVDARVIHVAGTNGKGSTCAMIAAIFRAAHHRTGLFTSPHLITFRERIQVDGVMIPPDRVAEALTKIRDSTANWNPLPTFFEIATALALMHFKRELCEIIVLETGLGGRLDATNAVRSDVAVITPVALDHQSWLGQSIAEIAGEKAGIIKRNSRVVLARQLPDAERVIRERARDYNATLEFVSPSPDVPVVALQGEHQKGNAALAIAAVKALDAETTDDAITRALANVIWPARFQRWNDQITIDGAHNPAGAQVLVDTWRAAFPGQRATLIFGALQDKPAAELLTVLLPIASAIFLPAIRSERATSPAELAEIARAIARETLIHICSSFPEALVTAQENSARILITGSLHFAGEALATLQGAELEECAQ